MAQYVERLEGLTNFGNSRNNTVQGVGVVCGGTSFTYTKLRDTAGVEWFLWFDTSGNLRTAGTLPTAANANTAGTKVGSQ